MEDIPICVHCQRAYTPEERNGVRELKTFKGYTVDLHLKEFRRVKFEYLVFSQRLAADIEFIKFASPQGKKLLAEMHEAVTR